MKKVKYILIGLFTLLLACLPFISSSMPSSRNPYTYYRVYYDGELLGTVKSEEELLKYINDNNAEYKEKYNVSDVYKPNNLLIKSYKTYESAVDDTYSVYKKIEALASFTLKGYEFSITNGENSESIFVLNEQVFNDAIEAVIKTFVDANDYENYNAIEVGKTTDIPFDYPGIMGVPITFLDKYCPDQFDIVGSNSSTDLCKMLGVQPLGQDWINRYRAAGGTGHNTANMVRIVYNDKSGKPKVAFQRIFIRHKHPQASC